MHIAESSCAQLSFGAIGGVIFDLQHFLSLCSWLKLCHEEGNHSKRLFRTHVPVDIYTATLPAVSKEMTIVNFHKNPSVELLTKDMTGGCK